MTSDHAGGGAGWRAQALGSTSLTVRLSSETRPMAICVDEPCESPARLVQRVVLAGLDELPSSRTIMRSALHNIVNLWATR